MGKRVALIGLDGSGKSANIEKMKRDSDYSDYYCGTCDDENLSCLVMNQTA